MVVKKGIFCCHLFLNTQIIFGKQIRHNEPEESEEITDVQDDYDQLKDSEETVQSN